MSQRVAVVKFCEEEANNSYRSKLNSTMEYHYLIPEGTPEKITHVIVPSGSSFKVVKMVREIPRSEMTYAGKILYVVSGFDVEAHKARVEADKMRQSLLERMQAKIDEASKVQMLKTLMGDDPEARELIEQFEKLGGSL